MRNVSDKSTEIQNTRFLFSNVFQKSYPVWDNMEKYCRSGQVTIWRVRITCWIS